jgi:hypothetical protein
MDAIQALKSAIEKNKVEVHIPIDIGGEVVEFMLDELDAYEIQEQQELKYQQALARATENGLNGSLLPDKEWFDYFESQDDLSRKRMIIDAKPKERKVATTEMETIAENAKWVDVFYAQDKEMQIELLSYAKPKDRAHFFAQKTAGVRVLLDVITGTLKLATGEKAFNTADDERLFKRWLSTDAATMKSLSDAYVELSKKVKEARDTAKKSSSRANGESVTPPPDDTQDIEALSVNS